jgi:hypothetical protein
MVLSVTPPSPPGYPLGTYAMCVSYGRVAVMLAAGIAKLKRFEGGTLSGVSVPALSQYLSYGSHGAN